MLPNYPEIDRVVLTLIQATGLLLPVVFLTFRFYLNEVGGSSPEEQVKKSTKRFVFMIAALTVTGFFATLGVFDWVLKPWLALIAVSSLAVFFALYGWFIYGIVN